MIVTELVAVVVDVCESIPNTRIKDVEHIKL